MTNSISTSHISLIFNDSWLSHASSRIYRVMTNTISNSGIPLILNDSWLAHMGSRIYRMAIEAIELLGNAFSYPLVQAYSGERLYQLVDSYGTSRNNKELYDRARFSFAGAIITSLKGEKNLLEKTKRIRTILNTHIIGLSILQAKDKKALSEHVAYTLLPSLIDQFGVQMANRSVLALHELDNKDQSKSVTQYAKLYRDITLQQSDLDSFVEALQELNSDVSKDILIHELLLSRNRNLTNEAKEKITSTLQGSHYIDIKVQRKLQLLKQFKNQNECKESEITLELKSHRDAQVEAIHYMAPSMFFASNSSSVQSTLTDDESHDTFYDAEGFSEPLDVTLEKSSEPTPNESISEVVTKPAEKPLPSAIPVGIVNNNQNCWYNSALQIMSNTRLYSDIIQQEEELSKNFPTILSSLDSYRNAYLDHSDIRILSDPSLYGASAEFTEDLQDFFDQNPNLFNRVQSYQKNPRLEPLHLDNHMQGIRAEAHNSLSHEFEPSGRGQEDSKQFLCLLLDKLSIDAARIPFIAADLFSLENKHLLLEKAPLQPIDLETVFAGTKYRPYGIIFHKGSDGSGHYFAAVRLHNSWYLCDDSYVEKISAQAIQTHFNTNAALVVASRSDDSSLSTDLDI